MLRGVEDRKRETKMRQDFFIAVRQAEIATETHEAREYFYDIGSIADSAYECIEKCKQNSALLESDGFDPESVTPIARIVRIKILE